MKGKKTGGRKAGTLNHATVDIKEACRKYGLELVEEMYKIAKTSIDERTRAMAIKELWDRGFGKAMQPVVDTSGEQGQKWYKAYLFDPTCENPDAK